MRILDADRIVKIALFGEQITVVSELVPGDYLAIRNLRLRPGRSGSDKDLAGRLGGDERLIFKLSPKVSANEDLRELLRYVSTLLLHFQSFILILLQTQEGFRRRTRC